MVDTKPFFTTGIVKRPPTPTPVEPAVGKKNANPRCGSISSE
jgi:hypothetical protein